jgi:Protein tyrosine and serine/threonine kinase
MYCKCAVLLHLYSCYCSSSSSARSHACVTAAALLTVSDVHNLDVAGTEHTQVRYMAPEVYKCEGYTEAVDVYAWAHLVAEMLTLERPYDSYRSVTAVAVVHNVCPYKFFHDVLGG